MNTRTSGTLKTWNSEKGYGFITPSNGDQDIFVHITDYPKQGGLPRVGEPVTFHVSRNQDGKRKAILVQRPGNHSAVPHRRRAQATARQKKSAGSRLIGFIVVAALCAIGYKHFAPKSGTSESPTPAPVIAATTATASPFQCDGRIYCSQMTSCSEARYFLNNCPGTQMDGDGDGIPCESQWCRGTFSE